jgi:FkbM family methyltransferase
MREALPVPVRRALRGVANYSYRVMLWRAIMREMHGISTVDRKALRRSALAAPLTAWGDFYGWRDPVLLADATVEVTDIGRFAVRARSDELYIVLPARERALVSAMRRLLAPGGVFVDAGANIGVATVLGRRLVGAEGRVIAIEMMPDTATRLRANLALNGYGDVTVVETALASESGRTVTAAIQPGHAGRATLAHPDRLERPRTVTVTTRTLAEILADVPRIDLLKLDLEGAELDALGGAEPVLPRIAAIAFEELEGDATSAWLTARDYAVQPLDANNRLATRR